MKMTFTATGDAIIQRHLPADGYPGMTAFQELVHQGQTRFFNLETTLHHYESYGSQYSGGGYLCGPPAVLRDLKKIGFNVTSFANNHTLDYSYGGLEKTLANVAQADLPCAGAGRNLQEAAQPVYFEAATGRVAVIAATSTFNPAAIAGNASAYLPGRPGLNPLRFKTTYYVTPADAAQLKEIIRDTHLDDENEFYRQTGFAPAVPADEITAGAYSFKVADKRGQKTTADPRDLRRFQRMIAEAKAQADYVLISIHCHEMQGMDRESVPDFLREFAHQCLDDGADAIVGHGPHTIRGVEIYHGRPIFYSLGDIILNIQNLTKAPADYFESFDLPTDATIADLFDAQWAGNTRGMHADRDLYEAVVPYWQVEDGKLTELTLTPVELGFDYAMSDQRKGWPVISQDSHILERLTRLSAEFGTEFEIQGNVAYLRFLKIKTGPVWLC